MCALSGPSGFEEEAARAAAELLRPLVDEVYTIDIKISFPYNNPLLRKTEKKEEYQMSQPENKMGVMPEKTFGHRSGPGG